MSWKKVKLVDICKPKQWQNIPISELSSEGYPVYGANGIIGFYKEYNHLESAIAVTCRGATCGTLNITQPKSFITSNAMVLDDIDESVDMKFLYYSIKNRGLNDVVTGAAQPQITRENLKRVEIPLPSLAEQIQIAGVLSKAENLIAKRKQSIELLDEFVKSTFLQMFGYMSEKKIHFSTLDEISTKITDGEHGTVPRAEKGRLYLMARNISKYNELDFSELSYISEENYQKIYKRCNPEKDDVLLVCVGATIGKVALVPEMESFSIARSVALIKLKKNLVNPRYILHFLKSELGIRQIKTNSNEAAQAGLYTGNIKKINIPIPPLPLQNKFAEIVNKVEVLKTKCQKSLEELENLYGSLSQKFLNHDSEPGFTGLED